ncbi:hypothetical protein [Yoonia sp. BS5-3]|uniref:Uncharacterized protein n=1 Tax=Yoonia phaeophyticola TaxID=3137369 RepID=A0ABZ2V811_9RHOB
MNDKSDSVAQLVMKRPDGRSILDLGSGRAATANQGDVTDLRAAEISTRLEQLGFTVQSGNLNTLSISGENRLFEDVFGLSPNAAMSVGTPAHSTKIPAELDEFVADVFVTPAPNFFP